MAGQSQGNIPQTQGTIASVPDSPPATMMDLTVQNSPDKETLKSEIGQLRSHLQFVTHHAENSMKGQQARFQRTAREYEQMARDVAQTEVAQATADVSAQYASQIYRAEESIVHEAEVALHTQEHSVVTQAENHVFQ